MEISVDAANELIYTVGQHVTWAKADLCPNRDPYSGAPAQGCPQCGGRGVIWGTPVDSVCSLVGLSARRRFDQFGEWEAGDVAISVPGDTPLYGAGKNDRIVFADSSEPFSIVLPNAASSLAPAILYAGAVIERVFWLDPATLAIVEGDIPALAAATGVMTWAPGLTAPPAGVAFTASGRRAPEYFLFTDLPQDRSHFFGSGLPRRMQLRKFDLFGK